MRKRTAIIGVIFSLAVVLAAGPAQAQVGGAPSGNSIGIIAGLNLARASFDPSLEVALEENLGFETSESKGKTGFFGGVTFDRSISDRLGFRVQGTILQTGLEFGGSFEDLPLASTAAVPAGVVLSTFTQTVTFSVTQLELGAMVTVPVGAAARANILAGLFLGFNMADDVEFESCIDDDCETDDDVADSFDFETKNMSLGFGAEFKATERVFIGALYKLGLTNQDKLSDEEDPLFNSVKLHAIQVFVRFLFGG